MQIDLKSINPATAGAIKYSSDCCPYFLPVPVYGQGSGDVEALSSYICRQAEMVGEWAHSYTTRLFESIFKIRSYLRSDAYPIVALMLTILLG